MTLTEYRAWMDGMIAATGDERLKLAREKLAEVQEAAPVIVPSAWPHRPDMSPPPFVSPSIGTPWWLSPVTCSVAGTDHLNIRAWNGRMT